MGTCQQCGGIDQDGRFCTNCGGTIPGASASAAAGADARRRRPGRTWAIVIGLVVLLLASGATAAALLAGNASSGETGTPSAMASTTVEATNSDEPAATADAATAEPTTAAAVQPVVLPLNPTMIVLDASSSMEADDAPGPRIDAAKNAVRTLVEGLPGGAPVGLMVYGTSTGDSEASKAAGCQDIKTLVPLGPVDKAAFGGAINGVVASGYTPIGGALRAAAAQLPATGGRNIVLVSDGEDSCSPPQPCAVAAEINGPGLAVHTVGFRVDEQARAQLGCIADAAGGSYVDAANAAQLVARLRSAVDPNTSVNTLTRTGFDGVKLGMSVAQAQQIDPAIVADESGTVQVVWRDCELTFVDGTLTAIAPRSTIATQDGLAVGDDISRAIELYGDWPTQTEGGSASLVVPTGDGGDAGYKMAFVPNSADANVKQGRIISIVLCLCRPAEPNGSADTERNSVGSGPAATEVVRVKPVDERGNLLDGFTPGGDTFQQTGTFGGERSQFGGTAYDVGGVAVASSTLHSCWPASTAGQLYCLPSLNEMAVVAVRVNGNVPKLEPIADADPDVRPALIQLDDRRICWARTHGSTSLRVTYICGGPDGSLTDDEIASTVSQPDKSGAMWTIQQVDGVSSIDQIADRENPPTRTAKIVKAWMNG